MRKQRTTSNFHLPHFKLKSFIYENRYAIALVFGIYLLALFAIEKTNFPYLDDVNRQVNGQAGFGIAYSRWVSEYFSWIVQGSRHLTDAGLASSLMTGTFLSVASLLAVYTLNHRQLKPIPLIVSTLIGLNPWYLQSLSFRFDAPYMALSILFSILPFLWWGKNPLLFFSFSFLGVLGVCNSYQSSSGIYIVMVLAFLYQELLQNKPFIKEIKKALLAMLAYILAMVADLMIVSFNPEISERGDMIKVAKLTKFPETIATNISKYFSIIIKDSATHWLYLALVLLVVFILSSLAFANISPVKTFLYTVAYLILGAVLSYGIFLIFEKNLAELEPRYSYGFGVFVAITLIMLSQKSWPNFWGTAKNLLILWFAFYVLYFPFVYAVALADQKDSFERQSIMLANDLRPLVNKERTHVYVNRFFYESRIVKSDAKDYPIITRLVPKNNSLIWTNRMLFGRYSQLNVTINQFSFTDFYKADKKVPLKTPTYKIYTNKNQIFIQMKDKLPKQKGF